MTTSEPTNTLIFTNLVKDAFLEENLKNLKASIEEHGSIMNYAPIKSFSRLLVSFEKIEDALYCKTKLNGTVFMGGEIKIYFAEYNYTITEATEHMLKLPDNDRLWLVSPPGSPPVGWMQEREEPPNDATLAEDLLHALRKLVDKEEMEISDDSSLHSNISYPMSSDEPTFNIQTSNGEEELPVITVQDWEIPKNFDSSLNLSSNNTCQMLFDPTETRRELVVPKTALPPILR
ncbi:hypothetical protein K7432_007952 [Basidiobolus ranarum]|uniref:Calcipressin n=1 Tax=Basidiobolus ranarum TaxID=34480 RepID=A0ABR2WSK4_9FUNG